MKTITCTWKERTDACLAWHNAGQRKSRLNPKHRAIMDAMDNGCLKISNPPPRRPLALGGMLARHF